MSLPDGADAHPRPPWSVTFPRTRARRQAAEAPAPVTGRGALMSGCGPRTETHPADAPAQGSGAMMTTMTTPESGDVAPRLAQASRLIRHAQSLAEKIAELTEDELASLCGLAANNHDQDQDPHGNEGNDGTARSAETCAGDEASVDAWAEITQTRTLCGNAPFQDLLTP